MEKLTNTVNHYVIHHHGATNLSHIKWLANTTIHLSPNNIGHSLGGIEAVNEIYELYNLDNYDYVVHLHPDVYITNPQIFNEILEIYQDSNITFFNTHSYPDDRFYDFDFFIFRPKLLKINIFNQYHNWTEFVEYYLHDKIFEHSVTHEILPRFLNNDWYPRRIDLLGLWHEHNNTLIDNYFKK